MIALLIQILSECFKMLMRHFWSSVVYLFAYLSTLYIKGTLLLGLKRPLVKIRRSLLEVYQPALGVNTLISINKRKRTPGQVNKVFISTFKPTENIIRKKRLLKDISMISCSRVSAGKRSSLTSSLTLPSLYFPMLSTPKAMAQG